MSTNARKPLVGTYGPGSVHTVGDGFPVRNLFPSNDLGERLSPFLLLDLAGPARFPGTDRPRGVGEHPHRGFETVTIVWQGRVAHRDSAGNAGVVGPGDVQWMTAGDGVVHEEMHEREFARQGGTIHMAQLWVNLPRAEKRVPPRYQDLPAARIPEVAVAGGRLRVIAGEHAGARGPAETHTPLDVWDARLAAGHALELDLPPGRNAGVVCVLGAARVNGSRTLHDAEMAWLALEGTGVRVEAEADALLLLLSGVPLGEPVASLGPFVMNTRAELQEAVLDYQSGRMGRLGTP